MNDDRYERTVTLPVRIVDGRPQPFYGPTWPALKEGSVADLVLPATAFVNPADEKLLTAPLGTELLPAGARLLAAVSDQAVGDGVLLTDKRWFTTVSAGRFVPFELVDPLRIQLRGTKRARLEACRCKAPTLGGRILESVNEAYTRISEYHEPHRRSHTGNVFQKVLYQSEVRDGLEIWCVLDERRRALEMTIERRFQQRQHRDAG